MLIIGSDKTPYTIYKEYGGFYSDVLLELNNIISYNMYYSVNGKFVCEPDIPNLQKGSIWDFDDSDATLQSVSQTFNFEKSYNIVKVIGDNVNGNIAIGTARNNAPSSSLSTLHIGNKLAPIITDENIDTDARAQYRANYELKRYSSMAVEVSITSIPLLHLDVDQVITITDSKEMLDREKFLINSITIPLSPKSGQTMILGVSNLTAIDFDIDNSN
jgi:hypothetical protein